MGGVCLCVAYIYSPEQVASRPGSPVRDLRVPVLRNCSDHSTRYSRSQTAHTHTDGDASVTKEEYVLELEAEVQRLRALAAESQPLDRQRSSPLATYLLTGTDGNDEYLLRTKIHAIPQNVENQSGWILSDAKTDDSSCVE